MSEDAAPYNSEQESRWDELQALLLHLAREGVMPLEALTEAAMVTIHAARELEPELKLEVGDKMNGAELIGAALGRARRHFAMAALLEAGNEPACRGALPPELVWQAFVAADPWVVAATAFGMKIRDAQEVLVRRQAATARQLGQARAALERTGDRAVEVVLAERDQGTPEHPDLYDCRYDLRMPSDPAFVAVVLAQHAATSGRWMKVAFVAGENSVPLLVGPTMHAREVFIQYRLGGHDRGLRPVPTGQSEEYKSRLMAYRGDPAFELLAEQACLIARRTKFPVRFSWKGGEVLVNPTTDLDELVSAEFARIAAQGAPLAAPKES